MKFYEKMKAFLFLRFVCEIIVFEELCSKFGYLFFRSSLNEDRALLFIKVLLLEDLRRKRVRELQIKSKVLFHIQNYFLKFCSNKLHLFTVRGMYSLKEHQKASVSKSRWTFQYFFKNLSAISQLSIVTD